MRLKILFVFSLLFLQTLLLNAQGLNHNFLVGYSQGLDTNVSSKRARLIFDTSSVLITPGSFKMPFSGSQANISDEQGNLLMYSNGCWISNAIGDTMQNGAGLNPGSFASSWCDASSGMPIPTTSVFLPWPGDSTKYILFHQTSTDPDPTVSSELFYSVIDITQNGGLGAVTHKNIIALQTALCPGFGVCKHANGRDWWIALLSPVSDTIYTLLLTPAGIISMPPQLSGLPQPYAFNGAVQFSPDGSKMAFYNRYFIGSVFYSQLRLINFDRCNGTFFNPRFITYIPSPAVGGNCTSFSSDSKYLYYGTFYTLFQINTDTTDIAASIDTVALYDNYCYPLSFTCANFFYSYLAADGKIYISPNAGIDFTYINQPDSEGVACDTRLHALRLPCYISRSNVYHPNYYLGPVVGSVCDSLTHVGLQEHLNEVQNFKISPNPSNDGFIKITYLLPQNADGVFEVFDLNGKNVFHQSLSAWSSLQNFNLSFLKSGIYECVIKSKDSIATQKLIII